MARRTTRMYAEMIDPETGLVDPDRWHAAHIDRTPVACCRCGGPVLTDSTEPEAHQDDLGIVWRVTRCVICQATTEIPGTKVFDVTPERPSVGHSTAVLERERAILGER
jgi:hypothetical protein